MRLTIIQAGAIQWSLRYLLFFVVSIITAGLFFCDKSPSGSRPRELTCTWNQIDSIDYLDSITCPEEFIELEGMALDQIFGQVQSVKVIYELDNDNGHFTHSKKYPVHFYFCRDVLGYSGTHADFNLDQYGPGPGRIYLCAAINRYVSQGVYTLEFFSDDQITADQILLLYNRIYESVYFRDSLYFLPTSTAMEQRTNALRSKIPFISHDRIYGDQTYQPLNCEEAYGYLTRVDSKQIDAYQSSRHDIVLTNGVPNDLPVIAGSITSDFQTPLSHVNVLSHNRKTPNMALKGAWNSPVLLALVNKLVYLKVTIDSFTIREAGFGAADSFWTAREPTTAVTLECNEDSTGLKELLELSYLSTSLVGAKAANFAELSLIGLYDTTPVRLPEYAFAIPFYFYRKHIKDNGIQPVMDSILGDSLFLTNTSYRQEGLKTIRNKIEKAPLSEGLLNEVVKRLRSQNTFLSFRFRSSTNAEDLPGFNGAGLYESCSGSMDSAPSIEYAIKHVYASLWSYKGYEERAYFKINNNNVAMGVLVHRAFPDEGANGVGITANIYNDNLWGLTVNTQIGEISVVRPPAGFISDQFIFYTIYPNMFDLPVIEYIAHSNVNDGIPVLSEEEIVGLAKALYVVKKHFFYHTAIQRSTYFELFAMDVEFKFDGAPRALYIKQARPY
jgi:pyruvate,water dikinase